MLVWLYASSKYESLPWRSWLPLDGEGDLSSLAVVFLRLFGVPDLAFKAFLDLEGVEGGVSMAAASIFSLAT